MAKTWKCDERCRFCKSFSKDMGACGYVDRYGHSRGTKVNGRMVYAIPCDKFEPLDGYADTPMVMNFESSPVKTIKERRGEKALKVFPERDELYASGLTDREMSERLGVTTSTIVNWRIRRGLKANGDGKGNRETDRRKPKELPERDKLYAEGLTDVAIGKQLGVSWQTIQQWRKRHGLPRNQKGAKAHGNQRQGAGEDA